MMILLTDMKELFKTIHCLVIMVFLFTNAAFAAEKLYFCHNAPDGSPLAITDEKANIVWQAYYKPFGEEQSVTGTIENNKRFIAKEKDEETGLIYINHRYYSPEIGRFITPDPIGPVNPWNSKTNYELLLNPQRLNPYAYGLNNPYKYIDPNGKAAVDLRGYYSFRQQVAERYLNWAPSWLQDILLPIDPTIGPMAIESGGGKKIIEGTKVLKNVLQIGSKEVELTKHALQRMSQRGVSLEQIQEVVSKSTPFKYFHEGAEKIGYYDPSSKIFIGEVQGKVTTVINNVKPQYIENLKKLEP